MFWKAEQFCIKKSI